MWTMSEVKLARVRNMNRRTLLGMAAGAVAGLGFVKDALAAAPAGSALKIGTDTVFSSPPEAAAIEEIIESGSVMRATSTADLFVSESSEVSSAIEGLSARTVQQAPAITIGKLIIAPDEIDWFLQQMADAIMKSSDMRFNRPAW